MIRGETFQTALDALRANKFKAFLTMLGVVIGSACLVLVVTIGLTGKQYILHQIEGVGANLIYGWHVASGPEESRPIADEISLGDLAAARQLPGVARAAGSFDTQIAITTGGKQRTIQVVGVTQDFQQVRNLDVIKGRFLDSIDIETAARAAVITPALAKLLPYDNPIGQPIKIGGIDLTVIGIFKERVATFGQSEITDETAIVPITLMRNYIPEPFLKTIYAQADNPEDVPLVTRDIQKLIASRHRPGAAYNIQNLASLVAAARSIANALTIVLLIVASITLVISGIGIMNIMLVTVTERTREIGVRMAIGARRREIEWQFLIEAFIISGMGALTGVTIAVAIPIGLQVFVLQQVYLPISWTSVAVSLGVSCSVGILFGFLPARRAARLMPTEALHYE
jgi:putative ABC transport system permease protein